jgi:hypothetical protein
MQRQGAATLVDTGEDEQIAHRRLESDGDDRIISLISDDFVDDLVPPPH